MRRLSLTLLATTAAVGLAAMSQVATAADLPRKAPPPMVAPPPPLWNWTGFYVGAHGGAGWSRNEFGSARCDGEGCFDLFDENRFGSHNGLGPLGGFQVGYNYQFANSPFVVGIEGEFSFADLKGDHERSGSAAFAFSDFGNTGFPFFIPFQTVNTGTFSASERFSTKVKDIAAITARLGIASGPQDRTLWYVKGGGAWSKTDFGQSFNASSLQCSQTTFVGIITTAADCFGSSETGAASGDRSRWGWTVGTGVEWGIWNNLSAKIEYDYLNFGTHDVVLHGTGSGFDSGGPFTFNYDRNVSFKQQIHVVKVGLNYRFDWGRGY